MTETLTINDGSSDLDFVLNKTMNDGRTRINDATDLLTPELLTIRHTVAKGGQGNPSEATVDRHLIQISSVARDAETAKEYTAIVNLTLAVPRTSVFDTAAVTRLYTLVQNTVASRVAAILRGEA